MNGRKIGNFKEKDKMAILNKLRAVIYHLRGFFFLASLAISIRFLKPIIPVRSWFIFDDFQIHKWFYYRLWYQDAVEIILLLLFVLGLYCKPKE